MGLAATAIALLACSGSIDGAGRSADHTSGTTTTAGSATSSSSTSGSTTASSSASVGTTTTGTTSTTSGTGAGGSTTSAGAGGATTTSSTSATGGAAGASGSGGTSGGSSGSAGTGIGDAGRDAETGMLLWDGDASKGTGVFKILNNEVDATVTTVTDPTYGLVWRFLKPADSNRCEAHGAKALTAKEGDVWYIGWRSKLTMPQSLTTNAVFQWKAYGATLMQNYPIVLKTLNGKLALEQYNPGGVRTLLWSAPFTPETWHTYVLGIKVSADINGGYVEFWFDGARQMLSNQSTRFTCRTLDGDYCDPKWGVYGAMGTEAANEVDALRIGTSESIVEP